MSDFTLDVNEDNFEELVISSDSPVLVDFWAEWCGPCKMLTPTIDAIAEEYSGKSVIAKINVDEAPGIATKYGIRSIPSILFFNNGEVTDSLVGAVGKEALTEILDKLNNK